MTEVNKTKLFEDYYKNRRAEHPNWSNSIIFDVSSEEMLNDLALKQADLDKDNDLLRSQITELTHKMEEITVFLGIPNLKEPYSNFHLKKKKKRVE